MENQSFGDIVECSFCFTRFGHKSSLVRHLKNNCNQSNRQSTRRRSCRQCASKKAKCNLKQPTCSRCSLRNIDCDYPKEQSTPASIDQTQLTGKRATDILQFDNLDKDTETTEQTLEAHPTLETEENLFDSLFSNPSAWPTPQLSSFTSFLSNTPNTLESLQMSNGGILTPDTELIGGPPLSFSAPDSTGGIIPYALAKHSMELIFRILRTWPEMLADEFQTPPLFHVTQIIPGKKLPYPLATCITLTKMWHGACEGAEELVRKTILQELGNLVDKNQSDALEGEELVAVLQAVVIYAIMLISPSKSPEGPLPDHEDIFRKVELLIYRIVRNGLFLQEEREQTRPTWEAWINVTSKRRAILSLYLLHWAYSVLHRVPCFDCTDLGFMPAPAPKALWQATTEGEWTTKYIQWLGRWSGKLYLQAELGWIQPGAVMNARAEKWLGETDEFGFIMISIVNAADYEPPGLKVLALQK